MSLRVCEHVEASLFMVYIAQSYRRVPCRSRVLELGSYSCGSPTQDRSELRITGSTIPGYDSRTTWTGKCSHANSPPGTRNCDEFCIETQRESNPRGRKLRPLMVSDPNHSVNRVYAIGTACSHHMMSLMVSDPNHSVNRIYTIGTEYSHYMM